MKSVLKYLNSVSLWKLFAFQYLGVLLVCFLVQFGLPKMVPSAFNEYRLLENFDYRVMHVIGEFEAKAIEREGWSAWSIWPYNHWVPQQRKGPAYFPSGVASAIYALTISEPLVLLPINALVHVLSAFMVYCICFGISQSRRASIIASLCFVFWPSSYFWVAQIHRDGYVLLGLLLFLSASMHLLLAKRNNGTYFLGHLAYGSLGILLIAYSRPLTLMTLLATAAVALTCAFGMIALKRKLSFANTLGAGVIVLLLGLAMQLASFLNPEKFPLMNMHRKGDVLRFSLQPDDRVMNENVAPTALSKPSLGLAETQTIENPAVVQGMDGRVLVLNANKRPNVGEVEGSSLSNPDNRPRSVEEAKVIQAKEEALDQTLIAEAPSTLVEQSVYAEETFVGGNEMRLESKELWDTAAKDNVITYETEWKKSGWLPAFIEFKIFRIAQTRSGFLSTKADLVIDRNHYIYHWTGFLSYAPRALIVGLLAPFPGEWLGLGLDMPKQGMRWLVGLESMLSYAALLGLLLFMWQHYKRPELWFLLIFCLLNILILGYAVPNAGTLYRLRYGYYAILVCLGIAFWVQSIRDRQQAITEESKS